MEIDFQIFSSKLVEDKDSWEYFIRSRREEEITEDRISEVKEPVEAVSSNEVMVSQKPKINDSPPLINYFFKIVSNLIRFVFIYNH